MSRGSEAICHKVGLGVFNDFGLAIRSVVRNPGCLEGTFSPDRSTFRPPCFFLFSAESCANIAHLKAHFKRYVRSYGTKRLRLDAVSVRKRGTSQFAEESSKRCCRSSLHQKVCNAVINCLFAFPAAPSKGARAMRRCHLLPSVWCCCRKRKSTMDADVEGAGETIDLRSWLDR